MIKNYDLSAVGQGNFPQPNWGNWYPSADNIYTNLGFISSGNADSYTYYTNLSTEKLVLLKIFEIFKDADFLKMEDAYVFNRIDTKNPPCNLPTANYTEPYRRYDSMSWMTLTDHYLKNNIYICIYWSRAFRSTNKFGPGANPAPLYYRLCLVRDNVIISNVGIKVDMFGTFGVNQYFKLIKNEKTGEFLITQHTSAQDQNGNFNIILGKFKTSNNEHLYLSESTTNPVLRDINGDSKYTLGLGTTEDSRVGFFNTKVYSDKNEGIIIPTFLSSYGTNKMLIDKNIPSLRKTRGEFKEQKEYVVDNKLYYCIWSYDDCSLLFDLGETVSK